MHIGIQMNQFENIAMSLDTLLKQRINYIAVDQSHKGNLILNDTIYNMKIDKTTNFPVKSMYHLH